MNGKDKLKRQRNTVEGSAWVLKGVLRVNQQLRGDYDDVDETGFCILHAKLRLVEKMLKQIVNIDTSYSQQWQSLIRSFPHCSGFQIWLPKNSTSGILKVSSLNGDKATAILNNSTEIILQLKEQVNKMVKSFTAQGKLQIARDWIQRIKSVRFSESLQLLFWLLEKWNPEGVRTELETLRNVWIARLSSFCFPKFLMSSFLVVRRWGAYAAGFALCDRLRHFR